MSSILVNGKTIPSVTVKKNNLNGQFQKTPLILSFPHSGSNYPDDFDTNPASKGWTISGSSWSSGQISGSGSVQTTEYYMRSGFVGIKSQSYLTGSAQLQYSLNSGVSWNQLPNNTLISFDKPHFDVMLKVAGNGNNWVLEKLKLASKFFKFVMNSMLGIIQLKLESQSNEKSANCDKF